jgi:hypothetical protein
MGLTLLAIPVVLNACSTKAKLLAQGGDCLQATDCEDGLVCVPQKDGRRICDKDLSGVQLTEDATPPRDAAPQDGPVDGPVADGPPPNDAEPDTGGAVDASE